MRRTSVLTREELLADNWIEVPCTSSIVVPADTGRNFFLLLTQNCSIGITAPTSGKRIRLRVQQDSVGSRTLTADGTFYASLTITSTANAITWVELQYNDLIQLWEQVSTGGGSSGANTALSNLASVAVNTSLVSDTDNTDDLGTSSIYWRQVFVGDTIVMKNATKIQANSGSSGTIYFDTAAIHLSFSAKPVSLWAGTMLALDAAVSLGSTPGTSGFSKSAASGGNLDCKYEGTVVWRIPDATTFHLVDVNLKLGVSTGTKIGTTALQKIGFWGATPVVQQSAIADATDATDAVTKFNTLLATLRTLGIIAT